MVRSILRTAAVCIMTFTIGCNWWLQTADVTGTVRIDGKPARRVQVVFEPLDTSKPRARATTDSDGLFRLSRLGPGNKPGAAVGRYRVKVLPNEENTNAAVIPSEYGSASTIEFDVVAGKPNVFDIDIHTK